MCAETATLPRQNAGRQWGRHRTGAARIHGMLALTVGRLVGAREIWRQRQGTVPLQQRRERLVAVKQQLELITVMPRHLGGDRALETEQRARLWCLARAHVGEQTPPAQQAFDQHLHLAAALL